MSFDSEQQKQAMSQQDLPCTPPHGCLVPPKFFPKKKSGFCRRY